MSGISLWSYHWLSGILAKIGVSREDIVRIFMLMAIAAGIVATTPLVLAGEQDKEAIQAAEGIAAKWMKAVETQDSAAIGALFTDDGYLLPINGAPPVTGRAEIAHGIAGVWKRGLEHETITVSNARALGKAGAWATGEYLYTGHNQAGAPLELKGRWLEVLTRDGNDWKIQILGANAALPTTTK